MTAPHPPIKRTFRITIDIEATIQAAPHEELRFQTAQIRYHQALVHQLQAHPAQLNHLLRAAATTATKQAMQLVIAEYGWGSVSDQQMLQPLIAMLEPAAQRYFKEEVEDGASVYFFDGYDATVLHIEMTELD
jgi:hypothetical protein